MTTAVLDTVLGVLFVMTFAIGVINLAFGNYVTAAMGFGMTALIGVTLSGAFQ